MTASDELIAAARALLPYLQTSTDLEADMSGKTRGEVMATLQAQIDREYRSRGERLRDEAERVDAEEAAIRRFRKAVAAMDG
ncbi:MULTISPECIES: hypothetical protein [Rhodomicrobium]|uniref:hypothetical protein n=1 Tax=Rhodomicrobium TaxID=1068 RepID=UPI000B4B0F01|nr:MULTISPECIES: hypothetical protein [Rhodomicrobium]